MIHNQVASVLALARNMRDGIDPSKVTTPVQTASLRLVIDTLLELGQPEHHAKHNEAAQRTVAEMIAQRAPDAKVGVNGW